MAVFSSEIVPGDGLAAVRGVGFGSPEGDSEIFARVKDQNWQAVRSKRTIEAPYRKQPDGPGGQDWVHGANFSAVGWTATFQVVVRIRKYKLTASMDVNSQRVARD